MIRDYNQLESMAIEKNIVRDHRLDDSSFSAVKRAERIRSQHGHLLIVPEMFVLGIILDSSIHESLARGILDPRVLATYITHIPADRAKMVDEGTLWDQDVENAINQARKQAQVVDVVDLYGSLLNTDPMMDFRFALTENTPVIMTEEGLPESKRRRYSF